MPLHRRRARFATPSAPPRTALTHPVITLWVLRALHLQRRNSRWLRNRDFERCRIAQSLPLPPAFFDDDTPTPQLEKLLQQMLRRAETTLGRWRHSGALQHNLDMLAQLIDLSDVEQTLLAFCICMHAHPGLEGACDEVPVHSRRGCAEALSAVLALPLEQVLCALKPDATLQRAGLVRFNGAGNDLFGKVVLLSDDFVDVMTNYKVEPEALLKGRMHCPPPPELGLHDFAHIQQSLDIALPYLRECLRTGQRGVNFFIYGPPGTGKTQLARVLAQACEATLYEVAHEDESGDPIQGSDRLRAYRAAQSFFNTRRALLVFDEVEDIFYGNERPSWRRSNQSAQSHKAWMNRLLEENDRPTLWLSNRIDELDPAFVRRFDLFMELPVPPRPQRLQMTQQHYGHLLTPTALARVVDTPTLAPALLSRAAKVVCTAQANTHDAPAHGVSTDASASADAAHRPSDQRHSDAMEHLLSQTLKAQGHAPLQRSDATRLPEVYDPAFICADMDLQQVRDGLAHSHSARICLYGPPGTGKTAYGRWLAQSLNRPLLLQRASDLQSKWVGETEKNIAAAFAQAAQDGAVLMIDEVDSFLQERRGAQRHWEVSQVNEMLTQMETFSGIFIASTNLMEQLDAAALRRFDIKVKLDYLQPAPAWQLFARCCAQLQLPLPPLGATDTADTGAAQALRARLQRLRLLTPGDFATAMRQHRFRPLPTASALLDALQAECTLKARGAGQTGTIGFV